MATKINLLELLQQIGDYVLIKLDEEFFPAYVPGGDVDLVVYDREEVVKRIHAFYDCQIGDQGELRVVDTEGHCQADFLFSGELELRVDLIDNFNFFRNLAVKPAYLTKIFKDRETRFVNGIGIFIPSPEDSLTLRYFEYLEWFDRRPDKIKHLEYICQVEDEDLRKRFFANTHRFIQFKPKTWQDKISSVPMFTSRRAAVRVVVHGCRYLLVATLRKWKIYFFAQP